MSTYHNNTKKVRELLRLIPLLVLMLSADILFGQNYRWESRQWNMFMNQRRSNFTVTGGVSTAALLVDMHPLLPTRIGVGGRLEAGYTFLWTRESGYHVGLGFTYSHSGFYVDRVESQIHGYVEAYNHENRVVRSSDYTAVVNEVHERYDAFFLQVPLQLAFQQKHFYFNAGFRFMLPLHVKASCDYGTATVGVGYDITGFGQHVDVPIETYQFAASESDYVLSSVTKGGVAWLGTVAVAIDGGYRWCIDKQHHLAIGAYANFGINHTRVGDGEPFVVLEGNVPRIRTCMQGDLAGTLRYVDLGVSLTYTISFGKRIGYMKSKPFKQTKRRHHYRR